MLNCWAPEMRKKLLKMNDCAMQFSFGTTLGSRKNSLGPLCSKNKGF